MFFYDGYACPVCGKAFTENDDIVACPVCGAPHHRACWQKEGHCHFAARHGTPAQWTKEDPATKAAPAAQTAGDPVAAPDPFAAASPGSGDAPTRVCPHCGHRNPEFSEFCSHCGRELPPVDSAETPPFGSFVPPAGNYREYSPSRYNAPSSYTAPGETFDGVDAEDVAAAVGSRNEYYLPRFRRMAQGEGVFSWNWAAFFLSPYWLFYRKQYLAGTLCLIVQLLTTGLSGFLLYGVIYPITGSLYPMSDASYTAFLQAMESGRLFGPMLALFLISLAELLVRFSLGAFGNRLYYATCLKRVRSFREKKPDGYPTELTALGGTSLVLGITAYVLAEFVGYIFISLL